MNPDICFYTGSASAFNVQRTLLNFGRMLSSEFKLHHVTTKPEAFGDRHKEYFSIYSPSDRNGHLGGAVALQNYLQSWSPLILTQVGRVPVNGNTISLLSDSETTFVCRYSGDLFYEYKLYNGLERAKRYAINNGLGRLPLYSADKVIVMGPREKRRIVHRGYTASDTVVLPPPVSSERFGNTNGNRRELGFPSNRKVVLFVGRVSELKGAATLEATIPEILATRDDLQFVFLGSRQYEFDLSESTVEHVTFKGRVPPAEIPKYMEAADLYVHPSLTEGISRSVVEALMAGTPVIARDVGDLAYATSNLFATDDDFVRMVTDLERYPVDDASKFDVEVLQQLYVDFYRDCLTL